METLVAILIVLIIGIAAGASLSGGYQTMVVVPPDRSEGIGCGLAILAAIALLLLTALANGSGP